MARIIVTADHEIQGAPPVLLEESVYPVHLSTGHAAKQFIERLGWALSDAEEVERAKRHSDAPSASRQPVQALRPLSAEGSQPTPTAWVGS